MLGSVSGVSPSFAPQKVNLLSSYVILLSEVESTNLKKGAYESKCPFLIAYQRKWQMNSCRLHYFENLFELFRDTLPQMTSIQTIRQAKVEAFVHCPWYVDCNCRKYKRISKRKIYDQYQKNSA